MASVSFIAASKLTELLSTADAGKDMYVRVLSASRLALGIDSLQPTLIVDLSKEEVGPYNRPGPNETVSPLETGPQPVLGNGSAAKMPRRSGDYFFEIKGSRVNCGSLKELPFGSLRAFEESEPGTLEKLSRVKGRSRRIVAHDPAHLFSKAHLAEKYAERLMADWWYGTNNSAQQTLAWLKRACSRSGLKWGEDFRTNVGGEAVLDLQI
jgi:hypothetical protein